MKALIVMLIVISVTAKAEFPTYQPPPENDNILMPLQQLGDAWIRKPTQPQERRRIFQECTIVPVYGFGGRVESYQQRCTQ